MVKNDIHIKNKKAYFEYQIMERYTAGLQLLGTEIKSIREGKANLNDAFCLFLDQILYVRNIHIAEYSFGSFYNHVAKRDRVLLLKKKELKKIQTKIQEKGLTLIPLYLFVNDRGYAKLEVALAQGKKIYDKRETIKQRDVGLDLKRRGL